MSLKFTPDFLAEVERVVRVFLCAAGPDVILSTRELSDQLWGVDAPNRTKCIDAMMYLAKTTLSDCATRGEKEIVTMFGKPRAIRRLKWHAPHRKEPKTCPKCGAHLKEIEP